MKTRMTAGHTFCGYMRYLAIDNLVPPPPIVIDENSEVSQLMTANRVVQPEVDEFLRDEDVWQLVTEDWVNGDITAAVLSLGQILTGLASMFEAMKMDMANEATYSDILSMVHLVEKLGDAVWNEHLHRTEGNV